MKNNLYEQTLEARDKLYSTFGKGDSDVLAPIVNPAFQGGAMWPALRQAFNIIRRDNSTIIISNGLSDPFDDYEEKNSGFEIEVMAETKQKIEDDISSSWLAKLVYRVSQEVAHNNQIKDFVEQYNVVTMEFFASDFGLEDYENEYGMIGVMFGIEHPERVKYYNFPGAKILIMTVKILTPDELDYAVEHRAEGRNKLHKLFKDTKQYHFNDLNRKSVLENKC